MRCVECGCERDPSERGWVTVLSPSGSIRVHYCPACMSELVTQSDAAEVDDYAKDE